MTVDLSDVGDDWRRFGAKAVNLCTCLRSGLNVPRGVALPATLVRDARRNGGVAFSRDEIAKLSEWLSSIDTSIAVRSSEIVAPEDASTAAGVFRSARFVAAELDRALGELEDLIFLNARTSEERQDRLETTFFLLREVRLDLSGVAHVPSSDGDEHADLWIVEGDLDDVTAGTRPGHHFVLPNVLRTAGFDEYWADEEANSFAERVGLWDGLDQIGDRLKELHGLFGPCVVEWGVENGEFWVLQAQRSLH